VRSPSVAFTKAAISVPDFRPARSRPSTTPALSAAERFWLTWSRR